MIRHALRALPFLLWCALVWHVSSASDPNTEFSVPFRVPDKLAHFLEYAAGGILAWFALAGVGRWPRHLSSPSVALVLCTLWGVLDEVHQSFVPGRTADPADVAADACGAAAGAWTAELVARRRSARRLARASR